MTDKTTDDYESDRTIETEDQIDGGGTTLKRKDLQNRGDHPTTKKGHIDRFNIRDAYSLDEHQNSRREWRGMVDRTSYTMNFHQPFNIVDDHTVYGLAIIEAVSQIVSKRPDFNKEILMMGVELDHPTFPNTFSIPLRPVEAYTPDFLNRELTNRLQSNNNLQSLNGQLDINLTFVKRKSGSGRPTTRNIIEKLGDDTSDESGRHQKTKKKKNGKTNITKNDTERFCLGIALVQAEIYNEMTAVPSNTPEHRALHKLWIQAVRVSDSRPNQSSDIYQRARQLLNDAGVTKSINYTMDDVKQIQKYYGSRYQIVVVHDSHDSLPLYHGPYVARDKVLALLCKDNHYQHIQKLSPFLGTQFYCTLCRTRSNTGARSHYNCPLICRKCLREGCTPVEGFKKKCEKCGLMFKSQDCLDAHAAAGVRNGRSQCANTETCKKCRGVYYTDRKVPHICNHTYCGRCNRAREDDHVCMMSSAPINLKNISRKRIFFDFETTAINGLHKVVLATALRCCPDCLHDIPPSLEEKRQLQCDRCSPDGQRFFEFECVTPNNRNVDVMQEFGKWLFHKRHDSFVAVAHNLKGFDGQFLLQELFKETMPEPDSLVLDGTKINFASVGKLRLIDSYNFVPFALATFPKAFNIDTIVKGDFPVLFIRPENYDYVGPMPGREFYPDSMASCEKRKKFEKFYAQMVDENHQFDFQKELRMYCYADVALLAASMVKYEQKFFETTNVVLFEETVTAASAAMKTFRRNFVIDDTIALDMAPKGTGIKQSVVAGRYLSWREMKEGLRIATVNNIGEQKIPGTRIHVDGYIDRCPKYPRGLAIEVKGCYWHAHCCGYATTSIVRDNMTAAEICEKDTLREDKIREYCDLDCIWECEIKEQRLLDPILDKYLVSNQTPGPVIPSEALYGGRTEPIRLIADTELNTMLKYKDFTSLYPWCMKYCAYPVGKAERISSEKLSGLLTATTPEQLNNVVQGIISCEILPPTKLHIPVLPYRFGQKLFFPLCRSCVEAVDNDGTLCPQSPSKRGATLCRHSPSEKAISGTYTSMELALAIEKGYRITKVHGAIHWDSWKTYTKTKNKVYPSIFSEYVDTFLKLKQEASGYPKGVNTEAEKDEYIAKYYENEGILLTKENIRNDPVARQVAKLLLNSLWGKMGQRTDRPMTEIIGKKGALYRLMEDPTMEIRSIVIVSDAKLVVVMAKVDDCVEPLSTSAMPYAVFTTSHARVHLYHSLDKIPDPEQNIMYMDTDSIIYRCPVDADPLPCGDYLGQLTDELSPESTLESFVTTGPKSYAYSERCSDGTRKIHLKVKGFPKSAESERLITMELMQKQVRQTLQGHTPDIVSVDYKTLARDRHHNVLNRDIAKQFRFTFNKRIIQPDGGTLPIGSC